MTLCTLPAETIMLIVGAASLAIGVLIGYVAFAPIGCGE